MKRKLQAAAFQLRAQLPDAGFDDGAFEMEGQIREAQIQQLFVGEVGPVGRNRLAGHGRSPECIAVSRAKTSTEGKGVR